MDNIKEGDIVRLKSGGPPMTVVSIKEGTAKCFWFAARPDPSRHEDEFPITSLELENGDEFIDEPMDAEGLGE